MNTPSIAPPMPRLMPGTLDPTLAGCPVLRCQAELHLQRPLHLAQREGYSVHTSLRGLLLRALLQHSCQSHPGGSHCTLDDKGVLQCQTPQICEAPWLFAPRSAAQKRNHAPPWTLHILDVEPHTISLELVIWGHRASAWQSSLWMAMVTAGTSGFIDADGHVPWHVNAGPSWHGRCAELIPSDIPPALTLSLQGLQHARAMDPIQALAQMAHDITQFVLADASLDAELMKQGCDERAELQRSRVLAACPADSWTWGEVQAQAPGLRRSGRQRGRVRLEGVDGELHIHAPQPIVCSYLAIASYWGLGGRRSFGQGRIAVLDAEYEVWAPCPPQATVNPPDYRV